jgi:hypothetical protein
MTKNKPTNEDIQHALNELRLIVLLEGIDGKFRQVALSADRFKAVSNACVAHPGRDQEGLKNGMEVVCTHLKDDWEIDADLFLGLSSIDEDADECESRNEPDSL